jgi:DNA polymerase epsilon subunit 1
MNWTWKGEYIPATRTEYELVKSKLETEWIQKGIRLPEAKQRKEIQKRLKQYSQTVYKKQKVKEEEERYVAAYIKPDLRTNPAHLLLL